MQMHVVMRFCEPVLTQFPVDDHFKKITKIFILKFLVLKETLSGYLDLQHAQQRQSQRNTSIRKYKIKVKSRQQKAPKKN